MSWPNTYMLLFVVCIMKTLKLLLYIIINWMARPCKILGQTTPPGQQTGFSETQSEDFFECLMDCQVHASNFIDKLDIFLTTMQCVPYSAIQFPIKEMDLFTIQFSSFQKWQVSSSTKSIQCIDIWVNSSDFVGHHAKSSRRFA